MQWQTRAERCLATRGWLPWSKLNNKLGLPEKQQKETDAGRGRKAQFPEVELLPFRTSQEACLPSSFLATLGVIPAGGGSSQVGATILTLGNGRYRKFCPSVQELEEGRTISSPPQLSLCPKWDKSRVFVQAGQLHKHQLCTHVLSIYKTAQVGTWTWTRMRKRHNASSLPARGCLELPL